MLPLNAIQLSYVNRLMSIFLSAGLDLRKIEKCMGDPNADEDNPVLKEEQDAQASFFVFL